MLNLIQSAMTELDAVNVMLMSIGQAPVNTLTVPGIKDVSFAQLTLNNASRAVQTRGWWFNRESDFPLAVNGEGNIPFPLNTLACEPMDRSRDLVERGRMFYDKDRHTADFTGEQPITVDVIWMLSFDDLPQAARQFIATRAARIFQANNVGSTTLYQFTERDEMDAMVDMTRTELRSTKTNALRSGARTNSIHRR
jgi:hypothetical protein